ncbi:hypothetical protein PMAC_001076 [Pneumocystis sp. 'macacae']|nr:hypothetical protein PMAC_001076 [Pneumocystis sp. 'macacae']
MSRQCVQCVVHAHGRRRSGRLCAGTGAAAPQTAAARCLVGLRSTVRLRRPDALVDRETSAEAHVQDWIAGYERDRGAAMAELVNGILQVSQPWRAGHVTVQCSGSDQRLGADEVGDGDGAAETLWEIQEASRKEAKRDYPIVSKTGGLRGLKKQIREFWVRLVEEMGEREHLFDEQDFMGQLQTWVVAMSSSTLRSLRHTSTVVSLAVVTGLCGVAGRLGREKAGAKKQYEGEKKKKETNKERMRVIEAKISAVEEQMGVVKGMMGDLFDSVFVHRYRDVDARIRRDCVEALGEWMGRLPSVFFEGTYLRYMGWVLSDISPMTRQEVVRVLTRLYGSREYVGGLRHFTERFKPRLIEMGRYEADAGVRGSSLELLDAVRGCGFLEDEEVDTVCTLLFDSDPKIRKKASPFFLSKVDGLFESKVREIGGLAGAAGGVKQGGGVQNGTMELDKIAWVKYKTIAELLVWLDEAADHIDSSDKENQVCRNYGTEYLDIVLESRSEDRMHLLLTAICPEVEELKNWELLSEYLLYDHMAVSLEPGSPKGPKYKFYQVCAPTEKEEIVLLKALYACVYMDIVSPDYDIKSKKKLSLHVKEEHEESISRTLLEMVPLLLKKYTSSTEASTSVLRLEQLMKLNVYQHFRQNKTYESLLDLIGKQFMKHPNSLIMKEAASSLLKAQEYDELASITREKILEIQEEVVNELRNIKSNRNLKTAHLSDKMIENLAISIKRLDYISSISDCIQVFETESFSVFSILFEIIEREISSDDELEIIISSLRTLKWLYIWRVKHLIDYQNNMPSKEFNAIIIDRDKLFDKLYLIVQDRKYYKIRHHAVFLLIDLYIVFSNFKKINTTQTFDESIFIIPEKAQDIVVLMLNYYIKQYTKFNESKEVIFLTDDESDQELMDDDDEKKDLIIERCMCEITGKIVLAILSGVMDKKYISYLMENKGKLGLSYNHVIEKLGSLRKNEEIADN